MQNQSVMFKGVNAIDFAKRFPNNESCLRFLEEKKWGNGYQCVHCGWNHYVKGKTSFYRRCQRCAYDESVTANTLFHDMHLPMVKAFYMLFRIATKKKGMSTVELAGEVGVQQKTAWLFKRKIQAAMLSLDMGNASFEQLIMTTRVEVAEDKISSRELAKSKGSRRGNPREMVNPETAPVRQLGFKGKPVYAMLFKIWLRGIHHKCSVGLFFAYCDEFWFRMNNRKRRKRIFDTSLNNVLSSGPHPYAVLKTSSA